MPGGVLDQARARAAAPSTALIEHHDAVMQGVEELPRALVGAGAGPPVQEYRRFAGRIAALLIVDLMDIRDAQVAVAKRLERRIQLAPRAVALIGASCFAGPHGT